jgi:hypothetical protein
MAGPDPPLDRPPIGSDGEPGYDADYLEYLQLLRQVDELVAAFDHHPDDATREQVLALLTSIDLIHRTALGRLVAGLRDQGAEAALDRVAGDRVVETLLALYDLAELDVPADLPGDAPADPRGQAPAGAVAFVPRDQLTLGRRPGAEG